MGRLLSTLRRTIGTKRLDQWDEIARCRDETLSLETDTSRPKPHPWQNVGLKQFVSCMQSYALKKCGNLIIKPKVNFQNCDCRRWCFSVHPVYYTSRQCIQSRTSLHSSSKRVLKACLFTARRPIVLLKIQWAGDRDVYTVNPLTATVAIWVQL